MLVTPVRNRITVNPAFKAADYSKRPSRSLTVDEGKLISAAFYNHQAIVNDLLFNLEKQVDVNARSYDGNTALSHACANLSTEVVDLLLKHRYIDVNAQDIFGQTPLMHYLSHSSELGFCDHLRILGMLLGYPKIDINIQDSDGMTAMMVALKNKAHKDQLMRLVKDNHIDLTLQDKKGKRAIDYMPPFMLGDNEFAQWMQAKTNRQLREKYPNNAPVYTIGERKLFKRGKEPLISEMENKIDINKLSPEENIWTKDEITQNFINFVQDQNFKEACTMLENTPLIDFTYNDGEVLKCVGESGNISFMEKVFDYKFNKQGQMQTEYDEKRKNLLGNLSKMAYSELKANNFVINTPDGFKILISNPEFNPNDMTKDKTSLFEQACKIDPEGNLAKQILSEFDDVYVKSSQNAENEKIRTMIVEYETEGKYRLRLNNIKRKLINPTTRDIAVVQFKDFINSEEFKPEITDEMGNNALHMIAGVPNDSARGLIQRLLSKGIDINSKNISGRNPLMSAIKSLTIARDDEEKTGILSNIKFLLDKGANINDKDSNGQTALHYACMTTSIALLTMLLTREPNLLAKDLKGNKAFKYIKTEEMKEIYQEYINK